MFWIVKRFPVLFRWLKTNSLSLILVLLITTCKQTHLKLDLCQSLEEIFRAEPGYIRFDHDPKHAKPDLHPLNHIDINYSTYSTYKIGLKDRMIGDHFEDMLNTNTNCQFLKYLS
jgi:hypothetical protein